MIVACDINFTLVVFLPLKPSRWIELELQQGCEEGLAGFVTRAHALKSTDVLLSRIVKFT